MKEDMKKYIVPTAKAKSIENERLMAPASIHVDPNQTTTEAGAKVDIAIGENKPTWL